MAERLLLVRSAATAATRRAAFAADLGPLGAGAWAGLDLAEVGARDPGALRDWLGDPDARPPGGESRTELGARVARFLERAREAPGALVAVTHASVVRAVVMLALGAPPEAFWRVDVAPASVTELRPREAGWLLARSNWSPA